MRRLAVLALALPLTGCLNPYAGEFKCPKTENGKCVSVTDAYQEAATPGAVPSSPAPAGFEGALYRRLTGMLEAPETPLVAPPKVLRVLLLPYEGDQEELYLTRYAYLFTDRPRWVLSDPTARPKEGR